MCEPIRLQEILYPVLVMARTDYVYDLAFNVIFTRLAHKPVYSRYKMQGVITVHFATTY